MGKLEEKKLNIFEAGENIEEVLANAGKVTPEIAEAAAAKIAERRKEKQTAELVDAVQKSEYIKRATHLTFKRQEKCSDRTKQYLKDITELVEKLADGALPVQEWDRKTLELKKQLDKDLIEIGKKYDQLLEDLTEMFPCSWNYRYSNLLPGNR